MLKKKTKLTTVALAVPSYDTRIEWASASRALMPTQRKDVQVLNLFANSSLLAFNFNNLWTTALNYKAKHKLDYFVMMHGDIVPEIYWLDKLLAIIESTGADLLGVAIPIKDHKGLTSLALSSEDPFTPLTQITMKQLAQLPETFSAMEVCSQIGVQRLPMPWLQVNTGLMIVRMNRSYTHNLYFTINDAIRQKPDGTYQAVVESEDWFFSRLVNAYGGKVMATKAVVVDHIGPDKFNNQDVWGADWDARLLQNKRYIKWISKIIGNKAFNESGILNHLPMDIVNKPATDLQPLWENDKGYFNTVGRKKFSLLQPDIHRIEIEEIAHALAHLCRFGGHCPDFYSVAQHSVLVWSLAPVKMKKAALLHDASEAYTGDVIKPLKNLLGKAFADIEYNLMATIGLKYGLTQEDFDAVKEYDRKAVELEFDYFFLDKMDGFKAYFNKHENELWQPADARAMFMWAYQQTFEG